MKPFKRGLALAILFSFLLAQIGIEISQAADSLGTKPATELAIASTSNISSIPNPSNQPDNLVSLTSQISKSVVTITCGNYQGTGWAINVKLTDSMITAGFKTYIITNHHVISPCAYGGLVNIYDNKQVKSGGIVWAWDSDADLAGIVTTTSLPGLNWQGPVPLQGQWAGIIGSPLGIPGLLSTGIISSVNSAASTGMVTAPINPGNSGGPVFDRTGTVIGIATAKYYGAEGLGIYQGTPYLCKAIVYCPIGTNAWYGQTVGTDIFGKNNLHLGEDAVFFTELTAEDLKGVIYCATSPLISDSQINQFSIKGLKWRITDLTTQKVLDEFDFTLAPSSLGNYSINTELPNGKKMLISKENVGATYGYTFKNQIKNHTYECAISFIAKEVIGEFTTKTYTATTDTQFYKPYVPEVNKTSSITCQKGKLKKTVKGTNPKCPTGYKRV
ncbi:MAG: serine protease [Actinomycetes bacterium]